MKLINTTAALVFDCLGWVNTLAAGTAALMPSWLAIHLMVAAGCLLAARHLKAEARQPV